MALTGLLFPPPIALTIGITCVIDDPMGYLTEDEIQRAFSLFGLGEESERKRFRDLSALAVIGQLPRSEHATEFFRVEMITKDPSEDEKETK